MKSRVITKVAYGFLAGTLILHALWFWKERPLIAKGYPDFTNFYSAGLMIRQGLGHRLYDDAVQSDMQRSFAPQVAIRQGPLRYMHPPFEALIFAPLTLLPYLDAYAAWNLLNLGMLALVPRLLRSHIAILKRKPLALWVLGLLAFFPAFSAFLQGQDVVVLLLLYALAFAALKRNLDFRAGCWLGLGSFKIHLALPLVLIILLGWKRPKVFLGFVAVCLCLGALSVAIVGWPQAVRYPMYLLDLEHAGASVAIVAAVVPNLRGLLLGWQASAAFAGPLNVATIILSLALMLWVIATSIKYKSRSMDLHFALATTASVLVSYHAFGSDLILLAIPLFIMLNCVADGEFQLPEDLAFLIPAGLLLLTPLYMFLSLRFVHLNLVAVILLTWLVGIQHRLKTDAQLNRSEEGAAGMVALD
jgi:hypothetical protein